MRLVTFLQLSPEFGGTKFGPFDGVEIRLGSDPDTNDISLPEDLGVAPQHVKVLQQGEKSYIVAPIDRTATVFIWRANSNKPKQITTPMAVTPGDSFSLVVPEGPRFTILLENLKKQGEKAGGSFADKAMKKMPTAGGLFEEIKRRGFSKIFTTKLGNMAMYAYRFVATGQIFSPIYIVAGIMMVSGWLLGGGALLGSCSLNRSKNDYANKYRTCEDQRAGLQPGDGAKPTVPSLTRNILHDNEWRPTLRDERPLYTAYAEELVLSFARGPQYKWTYRNEQSEVAKLRRALSQLPPTLTSTLAFLAAYPSTTGAREWSTVEDSEGVEVCARGPLRLTYRQGKRLGLENLQLDALVSNSVALSQDIQEKRAVLLKTAEFEGMDEELNLDGTVIVDAGGATVQGGQECMHLEGIDDRDDIIALGKRLRATLGASASGLPAENQPYWIAQRLVKLAAMDFKYGYKDLKFSSTNRGPISNLAAQDVSKKRRQFAAGFTAKIMANAVTAKCMAVLDKDRIDDPPKFLGDLPDLGQCAIVKAFVEYDRI